MRYLRSKYEKITRKIEPQIHRKRVRIRRRKNRNKKGIHVFTRMQIESLRDLWHYNRERKKWNGTHEKYVSLKTQIVRKN